MKYCFVFICQQGELEIASMLLAASLKENLKCDYELVAAIPQPELRWGKISATSEKLIKQLGVRKVFIENKINLNYPIGNKVSCFGIETDADKIIFLDSDILCVSQFDPEKHFINSLNAKPADLATFRNWKPVYDLFDFDLPKERVISTTTNEKMYPYFNAGMIAIDNIKEFSQQWIECCKKIDKSGNILNNRPWLDQIALPIVLKKLNWDYGILDERFNFPAHQKKMPEELPFLSHYHFPYVISKDNRLLKFVDKLTGKYPLLKELIKDLSQWNFLSDHQVIWIFKRNYFKFRKRTAIAINPINNYFKRKYWFTFFSKNEDRNIIITGIPRSGTSYLCKLLNTLENGVVINEPEELMILQGSSLWQLRAYFNKMRYKISKGHKIWNKIQDGSIIEDTALINERTLTKHKIKNKEFLLLVKNPLVFLAFLSSFKEIMPKSKVVVCIRNPIDTIASWKKSFPHLSDVIFEQFPKIFSDERIMTEQQKNAIKQINETEDFEVKRALLWNYLAEIINKNRDSVILIRYEDFIVNPNLELQKIFVHFPDATFDFPVSELRSKRAAMNEEEIIKITKICGKTAQKFNYKL